MSNEEPINNGMEIPLIELGKMTDKEQLAVKMTETITGAIDDILKDLTQLRQIAYALKYNVNEICREPERIQVSWELARAVRTLAKHLKDASQVRIVEENNLLLGLFLSIKTEREKWLDQCELEGF